MNHLYYQTFDICGDFTFARHILKCSGISNYSVQNFIDFRKKKKNKILSISFVSYTINFYFNAIKYLILTENSLQKYI